MGMAKGSIGIICSSPGFGGLELNLLKTARWLEEQGWTVRLLLSRLSEAAQIANGYCRDVTLIQDLMPDKDKLSAAILKTWQKRAKTDILFTAYNKDISPASTYKRFFNRDIKLVYQQHMKVGISKKSIVHRLRYNMINLWISPLPYLKEETKNKTTIPENKISVIPIPLDKNILKERNIGHDIAIKELQLPEDKIIIGVLGRIDPKKGQDFLVRCMIALEKEQPGKYHLLIMGNVTAHEGNAYVDLLREQVKQTQLENAVSFRPYRKDVAVFYQAIDVFAMPSHGETYGMVTLEAMFFGKPVIGVNTDGTKALLEDGKAGWLIQRDDVAAFIKKLPQALLDTEYKKLYAQKKIMDLYSMEKAMPKLEQALLKIPNLG